MSSSNSTTRFSDRVDFYIKSRPSYPASMMDFLQKEGLFTKGDTVADIGSGTGISAQPFLEAGAKSLFAVEPNDEMRLAAENIYLNDKSFISVNGTAEDTNLDNNSVDLIVCAQAFHWFDRSRSREEFKRILKRDGNVLLVWNDRKNDSTDFMIAYNDFVKMFGTDYNKVNHQNITDADIEDFFKPCLMHTASFVNEQKFNFEGLKNRVLSSSYMPNEQHKDYEFMLYVLKKIFKRYHQDGIVTFEYNTKIYYGKL